jgi:hypothetical protein
MPFGWDHTTTTGALTGHYATVCCAGSKIALATVMPALTFVTLRETVSNT